MTWHLLKIWGILYKTDKSSSKWTHCSLTQASAIIKAHSLCLTLTLISVELHHWAKVLSVHLNTESFSIGWDELISYCDQTFLRFPLQNSLFFFPKFRVISQRPFLNIDFSFSQEDPEAISDVSKVNFLRHTGPKEDSIMTRLIFHKLILIALIMLLSVNYFLIFSRIRFCVQSIPDEPTDSCARLCQWPLPTLLQ